MPLTAANLNQLWAKLIIEELIRNDISTFYVSPGSRSTPLAIAIFEHPKAEWFVHFDERGSAFAALGNARATQKPAVWVTTSGTAVANGLPAVIEAYNDRVPFLALTADRPPELYHTDANQTITQTHLFGHFANAFFDLPAPNEAISPAYLLTTLDQAISRTLSPKGAVHLNCQFREPLAPTKQPFNMETVQNVLSDWIKSKKPFTQYHLGNTETTTGNFLSEITKAQKGLLVIGKLDVNETQSHELVKMANALGFPVLADIGSGLRFHAALPKFLISHYDSILQSEDFRKAHYPDVVLQIGSRFTSKRLLQFLAESKPKHYFVVKDHPFRSDPNHQVTHFIQDDLQHFSINLRQFLSLRKVKSSSQKWRESWIDHDDDFGEVLDAHFAEETYLTEPAVAYTIAQQILPNHGLFLGNSMPIRDMDMFARGVKKPVWVAANRGASGIDGVVSSAIGFANGLQKPTTLLIGDVSFLHDLNALAMLRTSKQPLVMVVINNDGGGIFSFLPIGNAENLNAETFETMFATPHHLQFDHLAKMFNLVYHKPSTLAGFQLVYEHALASQKSILIEISTNRHENVEAHALIKAKMNDPRNGKSRFS